MSTIEDRFASSLAKAAMKPATKKTEKSLTKIIIENWSEIQEKRKTGVTYKQIVEGMNEVNNKNAEDKDISLKYFMTCVYRAKKKMDSNPELIKQNNSNTKTENETIIKGNSNIKHETNTETAESSALPKKIIGKAQAEAAAQKELYNQTK